MDYTRTSQQSVAWFRSRAEQGTLESRPPFQRLFVWSRRQQSALIETILLGYPIPEIYMQESISSDGEERYVLVDGQQRINTVLDFLGDRFSLDNEVESEFAGLLASQLEPSHQRTILQYQFVVRTLPPDWDERMLRDIFARINRGVSALNEQELRHATYWGPFLTTMEDLAADERWDALGIFKASDVRRMLDVEYISELSVALMHGPQNKKDNLNRYYLLYEEDFEQETDLRESFDRVLRILVDLFDEMDSRRWRKRSDFYTLFLLLAQNPDRWTNSLDRAELVTSLSTFAEGVDDALSRIGEQMSAIREGDEPDSGAMVGVDPRVTKYVLAVRGAASDLAARVARSEALDEWLLGVGGDGNGA